MNHNMHDEVGKVVAAVLGLLLLLAVFISGNYCGWKDHQQAAVKAGHAKYVVNSEGDVSFVWNENK